MVSNYHDANVMFHCCMILDSCSPVQNVSCFSGTLNFMTVFTKPCHYITFCANKNQSTLAFHNCEFISREYVHFIFCSSTLSLLLSFQTKCSYEFHLCLQSAKLYSAKSTNYKAPRL
jgi:hypothetical protein